MPKPSGENEGSIGSSVGIYTFRMLLPWDVGFTQRDFKTSDDADPSRRPVRGGDSYCYQAMK